MIKIPFEQNLSKQRIAIKKHLLNQPVYGRPVIVHSAECGDSRLVDILFQSLGYVPLRLRVASSVASRQFCAQPGLVVENRHEIYDRFDERICILGCFSSDGMRFVHVILGNLDSSLDSCFREFYCPPNAFITPLLIQVARVGSIQHYVMNAVDRSVRDPSFVVVRHNEWRGIKAVERKLVNLCKFDILSRLANCVGGKVLDVGSGKGGDLMKYSLCDVSELTMCEADAGCVAVMEASIDRNHQFFNKRPIVVCSRFLNLDDDAKFDHIVFMMSLTQILCQDSIEHVAKKISGLLRDGGTCTILMPNFSFVNLYAPRTPPIEMDVFCRGSSIGIASMSYEDRHDTIKGQFIDEYCGDVAMYESFVANGMSPEHDSSVMDYVVGRELGAFLASKVNLRSDYMSVGFERLNSYRVIQFEKAITPRVDLTSSLGGVPGGSSLLAIYPLLNWNCDRTVDWVDETVGRQSANIPCYDEGGRCDNGAFVVNRIIEAHQLPYACAGIYVDPDANVGLQCVPHLSDRAFIRQFVQERVVPKFAKTRGQYSRAYKAGVGGGVPNSDA